MATPIGIDLGTTYTVVATLQNQRPVVLPNAEGQHLTPSVVALPPGGLPVVGQPAKDWALAHPHPAVFSIKRKMGSEQRVRVTDKEYTPQEVSSFILAKVKADAERYLGERIDQAVITVPAYFNDRQRQATREAGVLAGLDVPRIINEPTAAALAYGLSREEAHTILVWDLGGGTFDVSLLELGEGIFQVLAVSGDARLGGDDFDQRLMHHLAAEYREATSSDFPEQAAVRQRLREAAEKAKIDLSSHLATRLRLPLEDSLAPRCWETAVTRERLESLTADLLQRMVIPTQQALSDASLSAADIDRVLLVGGATRMPAVRQLVRQLLGQEPYRYIDPDRVVALGAAIQAGMLLGLVDKVALLDVLPLSLGVETQGGLMSTIIRRNTPLPASEARVFATAADYQTSVDVHVLQGERALAADNVSLGRFELEGIPPARRGEARVEIAFEADVDGVVHITARDLLTEGEVQVKLTSTKQLDRTEIDLLAEEARHRAQEDGERREQIEARIEAGGVIAAAEMALSELGGTDTGLPAKQIANALAGLRDALAADAPDELRQRSQELRQLLTGLQ